MGLRTRESHPAKSTPDLVAALRLVAECADHSVDDYHLRAIVRDWCIDRANELEAERVGP